MENWEILFGNTHLEIVPFSSHLLSIIFLKLECGDLKADG